MGRTSAEDLRVGYFQVTTLLLLSVNFLIVSMSHAITIFYKYTPKFYCQLGDERNRTEGCMTGCLGHYGFSPSRPNETSVAMDWQLICEREHLLGLGSSVYYAGLLFGAWFSGCLADRVGRLPVLAVCLYAQGTMAVALNVVQEYPAFLLFRALQGFFIQGLENATFVLCIELFPAPLRALVTLVVLSAHALGLALLAGLSYVIADWRILQLAISIPTALTVLYIWVVPESPRWLLARGKFIEADMAIEKISMYNGCRCCKARKLENEDVEPQSLAHEEAMEKTVRSNQGPHDLNSSDHHYQNIPQCHQTKLPLSVTNQLYTESLTGPSNRIPDEDSHSSKVVQNYENQDILQPCLGHSGILNINNNGDNQSSEDNDDDQEEDPTYLYQNEPTVNIDQRVSDGENNLYNYKKNKQDILEFFQCKLMGPIFVIVMLLWFTSSMSFHVMRVLPTQRPSKSRQLSLTMASGFEIFAFFVTYCLVIWSGRRIPFCTYQVLVGLTCFGIAFFAIYPIQLTLSWIDTIKMLLVFLGKIVNFGSFFILRILTVELSPTIFRATLLGLCIAVEMLAGILTPYVLAMENIMPNRIPYFFIGFICICAGLMVLLIPETSCQVLPDENEDAKRLHHKKSNKNVDYDLCHDCDAPDDEAIESKAKVLREELFAKKDMVDAGNGIIVNFTEIKTVD